MHGNVIPALAAAKVNLVNNELTQPLFIAAKNKSPVEATLRFADDRDGTKNSDQNGQYDTQQKGYRSEYSRHNEFIQKVSHRQCAKEAQGADFSRKRPK